MARLLIQSSDGTYVSHELNDGTNSIGRSPENTIVLEGESVSSHHAEIIATDGQYILRDLQSSNGTKVNGMPTWQRPLEPGDIISFGQVECRFLDHIHSNLEPASEREPGWQFRGQPRNPRSPDEASEGDRTGDRASKKTPPPPDVVARLERLQIPSPPWSGFPPWLIVSGLLLSVVIAHYAYQKHVEAETARRAKIAELLRVLRSMTPPPQPFPPTIYRGAQTPIPSISLPLYNPSIRPPNTFTPYPHHEPTPSRIHDAAGNGDEATVQQVLTAQPNQLEALDDNGMTPLHVAVREGKTAVVRLLLAKGAKVNARYSDGGTALHIAALNGRADIIKLLLSAGADPQIENKGGKTALSIAAHENQSAAIEALKGYKQGDSISK